LDQPWLLLKTRSLHRSTQFDVCGKRWARWYIQIRNRPWMSGDVGARKLG
jgi:hypothetical protein